MTDSTKIDISIHPDFVSILGGEAHSTRLSTIATSAVRRVFGANLVNGEAHVNFAPSEAGEGLVALNLFNHDVTAVPVEEPIVEEVEEEETGYQMSPLEKDIDYSAMDEDIDVSGLNEFLQGLAGNTSYTDTDILSRYMASDIPGVSTNSDGEIEFLAEPRPRTPERAYLSFVVPIDLVIAENVVPVSEFIIRNCIEQITYTFKRKDTNSNPDLPMRLLSIVIDNLPEDSKVKFADPLIDLWDAFNNVIETGINDVEYWGALAEFTTVTSDFDELYEYRLVETNDEQDQS